MLKFVVLGLCLFAAIMLFKNKGSKKEEVKAIDTTDMVKDPICGTYVDETTKHKVKYYDKVYCFCSQECLDKFKEEKGA